MKRNAGFTLMELMIAISIITILSTIAVPSFYYMNNLRITQSQIENLQRTLSMARQMALAKNRQTIVCPSGDGSTCNNDNDWSYGYMAYIDRNRDGDFNDAQDQLIEYIPGVRNVATRKDTSSFSHKLTGSRSEVKFSAQGAALETNQTLTYCDGNQKTKFEVVINLQGRIEVRKLPEMSCS